MTAFPGPVWCTEATRALCGILLPDSARLLEEEAWYANKIDSSRHHPAEPLYTERDAHACLDRFRTVPFEQHFTAIPGIQGFLKNQGRILGAAAVTLDHGGIRITFSGDIGRSNDPIMPAPAPPAEPEASDTLRKRIERELHWQARVPEYRDAVDLRYKLPA